MADNNIRVSIEISAAAAQKALDDIGSKSEKVDKGFQDLKENGTSTFDEIGLHIGKTTGIYDIFAGNLAANLAIKALELLGEAAHKAFEVFVSEGIHAASEYQAATQTLNSALASSGLYTAEASKGFQEYADQIQATTKYSNTAVIQNAALIESITHLDKDGLKVASKASVELAARLGIDLASASELVSKAFEGNVKALKRKGIEIEVASTKTQTYANFLDAMASSSHRAEDETNTFSGALIQAHHAFEEIQKAIGNVIVQNPVVIEGIRTLSNEFLKAADYVNKNKKEVTELAANGFLAIVNSGLVVIATLDAMSRVFTFVSESVIATSDAFSLLRLALTSNPLSLFTGEAKKQFIQFKNDAVEAASAAAHAFSADSALGKVGDVLATVLGNSELAFAKIAKGADGTVAPINSANAALKGTAKVLSDADTAAQALSTTLTKESLDAQKGFLAETKVLKTELDKRKALNAQAFADHKITKLQEDKLNLKAEDDNFEAESKLLSDKYQKEQVQLDLFLKNNKDQKATYDKNVKQLQDDEVRDFTELNNRKTKIHAAAGTQQTDDELKWEAQKSAYRKETLTGFSSLMQTSSRELFAIGKAAALANATINTYEAVTKTMAFTPYPYNIPLAIAQGVAGAVQISNIASQNPSFEQGGIVPGTSFSGDKVTANVNSGEMILNRQQQAQLFKQANGSGTSGGDSAAMSLLAQCLSQPVQLVIDGKVLIDAMRDQTRMGRTFA
jgi:hypothetical protein